jgi:hypothetical protein
MGRRNHSRLFELAVVLADFDDSRGKNWQISIARKPLPISNLPDFSKGLEYTCDTL